MCREQVGSASIRAYFMTREKKADVESTGRHYQRSVTRALHRRSKAMMVFHTRGRTATEYHWCV